MYSFCKSLKSDVRVSDFCNHYYIYYRNIFILNIKLEVVIHHGGLIPTKVLMEKKVRTKLFDQLSRLSWNGGSCMILFRDHGYSNQRLLLFKGKGYSPKHFFTASNVPVWERERDSKIHIIGIVKGKFIVRIRHWNQSRMRL